MLNIRRGGAMPNIGTTNAMPRKNVTPQVAFNINDKPSQQQQGNWEHCEILSLIRCKRLEHHALKELINICFHMVFATQMSSDNDYLYN
jgi:hypothetical protein